jgi:hypothetical protein
VEAGRLKADLTEDRQGEDRDGSSKRGEKRIVPERNLQDRLGDKVPPAAGETRGALAGTSRLSLLAGYTIPRAVSPIAKCYDESLPAMLEQCIIRFPVTRRRC